MTNSKTEEARITNYGAIVVSLRVPCRGENYDDVVLGYETVEDYSKDTFIIGGIVERFANRIAKSKFSLNGTEYGLPKNDGENHLHGRINRFDTVISTENLTQMRTERAFELKYVSKDGKEGYPVNLSVKVVYTLTDNNELKIEYSAAADQNTVVNLINHS